MSMSFFCCGALHYFEFYTVCEQKPLKVLFAQANAAFDFSSFRLYALFLTFTRIDSERAIITTSSNLMVLLRFLKRWQ